MKSLEIIKPKSDGSLMKTLSEPLMQLLSCTIDQGAERIKNNPVLQDEARQIFADLRAEAMRPAGPEGVKRVLSRYFKVFEPLGLENEEVGYWLIAYVKALEKFTEAALDQGMQDYLKVATSSRFPMPGVIAKYSTEQVTPASKLACIISKAGGLY